MPYRINPSTPPADEVRRVAGEQLGRALRLIESADGRPDPESVRRVRVCCKRARGVLRLARAALGDDFARENHELAQVARTLAAARDAQAVLDAFDGITPRKGLAPALVLMRATLDAQRDLEAAGAGDTGPSLDAAHPLLREALARIPGLPLDALTHDDLWDAFARTYKQARRAMGAAMADPDPLYSHEWRTWAKRHWYHVRLLNAAAPKAMRARAQRLDRLASRLGRRHDLDLLRERLRDPAGPLHALGGAAWTLKRAERAAGRLTLASARDGLGLFADPPRSLTKPLAAGWRRRAAR